MNRLPARQRSTRDLKSLQRLMAAALMRPLTSANRLQSRWTDGRPMRAVAASFIKPNDRLTSFERLEIYARCYWFRLLDCLYEDCPGLRAVLGEKKFMRLAEAYLAEHPSRSFTLRNLPGRLERFLRRHPRLSAPHTALAIDVARFEWAQTVAFDGPAAAPLAPDQLAAANPARLRLGLQPYLSLLTLNYAVDDFILAVKKDGALRGEASHTPEGAPRARKARRVPRPKPQRVYVAVHRHDNTLYYKRLEPAACRILRALGAGRTVAQAVAPVRGVEPEQIQSWFKSWTELGWLCARPGR
ncbi:MAG TPA: DNA-binding domain-containing protein [Opitutaceae bacterium]|nr:DNA-binding domain-containing protein [Opitutaceae bacterium]